MASASMNRLLTFTLILIFAIATVCVARSSDSSSRAERPNIILILSDDVGIGDVGCCGGPFKTPQIDALAKGGIRFEYCYSTPLCGPSRCELLTGRYPFRTGLINNNSRNAIQPGREIMIPTVMKRAGYATVSVGKWGQMSFGPGEWGFDEYLVFPGSGRYWREQTTHYRVNGKGAGSGRRAISARHHACFLCILSIAHKDQPFFVYYPMSHIHGPIVRTPDSKEGAGRNRLYADNIEYMDKLVGKLIDELDRLNLRDKTLVLFTGDNGTARFGAGISSVNGRSISGMKATMLEGGSRVPLVANWPGVTPAGKVNGDLIDFSDFFATFAELGGAKLPEGVTLDSRSFAPQIKGEKGGPRDWVYVELNGKSYVRDARFKLTNGGELYDLSDAPYQGNSHSHRNDRLGGRHGTRETAKNSRPSIPRLPPRKKPEARRQLPRQRRIGPAKPMKQRSRSRCLNYRPL